VAGQKASPPKPEGQKKKEQRDAQLAQALQNLRAKRREENKTKRVAATKRAQENEANYQKSVRAEIDAIRTVLNKLFRPRPLGRSTYPLTPSSPSS
jgi:hypothetical protein